MRNTVLRLLATVCLAASMLLTGCSLRKLAISKIGDSLASGGTTFAADDDPELIAQALPFSLKMIDSLLAEAPQHRGLLLAAASGYVQYAYAFVQQEADALEEDDLDRATEQHDRAARLYVRGRDYGLRGLDAAHPGFQEALRRDPLNAVRLLTGKDVPLVYWTAVSWGAAIALSKTRPGVVTDQPIVEALIDRALELDEGFDSGAIHGFLITYEPARQGAPGDFAVRSQRHFERAVELTGGHLAGPYVALAEAVCIAKQNRGEYERLLQAALAIDPNQRTEWRLANLVAQKRARWLLSRAGDLFLDSAGETTAELKVPQPW